MKIVKEWHHACADDFSASYNNDILQTALRESHIMCFFKSSCGGIWNVSAWSLKSHSSSTLSTSHLDPSYLPVTDLYFAHHLLELYFSERRNQTVTISRTKNTFLISRESLWKSNTIRSKCPLSRSLSLLRTSVVRFVCMSRHVMSHYVMLCYYRVKRSGVDRVGCTIWMPAVLDGIPCWAAGASAAPHNISNSHKLAG